MTNPWTSFWVFSLGYSLAALWRARRFPYSTATRRLHRVSE